MAQSGNWGQNTGNVKPISPFRYLTILVQLTGCDKCGLDKSHAHVGDESTPSFTTVPYHVGLPSCHGNVRR